MNFRRKLHYLANFRENRSGPQVSENAPTEKYRNKKRKGRKKVEKQSCRLALSNVASSSSRLYHRVRYIQAYITASIIVRWQRPVLWPNLAMSGNNRFSAFFSSLNIVVQESVVCTDFPLLAFSKFKMASNMLCYVIASAYTMSIIRRAWNSASSSYIVYGKCSEDSERKKRKSPLSTTNSHLAH